MGSAFRPDMPANGGDDVLQGGAGDDLLVGGDGQNLLVGGFAASQPADAPAANQTTHALARSTPASDDGAPVADSADSLSCRSLDHYFRLRTSLDS
jgi:hypothetical protein